MEDESIEDDDDEVTFFKPYDTDELIRLLRLLDQLRGGEKEAWKLVGPTDVEKINRLLDRFGN